MILLGLNWFEKANDVFEVAHVVGHHEAQVTKVEHFLPHNEVLIESTLCTEQPGNICLISKLVKISMCNGCLHLNLAQVVQRWTLGAVYNEVLLFTEVVSLELLVLICVILMSLII